MVLIINKFSASFSKLAYIMSELQTKFDNFKTFINEHEHLIGDKLSELFTKLSGQDIRGFLVALSLFVYPYYLKNGKEGLKNLIDRTSQEYEGKKIDEVCSDKDKVDKLVRYLLYFCHVIDENNKVYGKV